MFDKKKFEALLTKNNIIKRGDKSILNDAYEVLRNQVANLAKFRHPNVLTLIEPLEEHKASFLFVTELVTGCLNTVPPELDDVSIQKGLLQVANALEFVHNQARMVHLSIQPSSIFINDNSDWKVSGLGHLQPVESEDYFIPQYDPRMPGFININLNYTAPEVVFENKAYPASDMFSLGCVIYYLYNDGSGSIINCNSSTNYYKEDYEKFERMLKQNNPRQLFKKVPESLFKVLPQLISRYPNQRITPQEFIESDYFNNPLVKVMVFLDEFPTKSDEEKLIFLKSLINLLPLFPQSILQKKILPIMSDLLQRKIVPLIQVTLTIILIIGKTLSQLTFHDKIYETVIDDKLLNFEEAQIVLLENLDILQQKVKNEEFKKLLLKLTDKTLDLKNSFQVQAKTLDRMDIILQSIDFPNIKNNIFPKICLIFSKTTSLQVKLKAIEAFVQLIDKKGIDKFIISETLLPLLKSMKTRELKIMSAILQVYKSSAEVLDEDNIVEHVIPQLWILSMATTLNPRSYKSYIDVTNDISKTIQTKHMEKLRSLEGSKPQEDENDTEKFRHLLYGKEEQKLDASNKPEQPSSFKSQPLSPSMSSKANIQSKKAEPLSLKPTKRTPITSQTSTPNTLSFGATSNTMKPIVRPLQTNPIPDDDDFEDFVSAPQSRTSTPSQNQQPSFTTLSPKVKNLSLNNTQSFNKPSTIDWTSEANKSSKQNNTTSTPSFAPMSMAPAHPTKLPPGFGDSLLMPSKKSNGFQNGGNSYNDWNNGDSLI
ncbi:Protein kinase-like protein SCY1 [Cyberlindnera fabianii]|uniref:Protein kinase-like protein SCY1 n=1 Tax=Cyberlindnera fabianii TaxID=36022 RepID=A0A1V2LE38_CYBFA|nr:Protein kinase-like protein SCY1 [Cyberlindnera fabianii]